MKAATPLHPPHKGKVRSLDLLHSAEQPQSPALSRTVLSKVLQFSGPRPQTPLPIGRRHSLDMIQDLPNTAVIGGQSRSRGFQQLPTWNEVLLGPRSLQLSGRTGGRSHRSIEAVSQEFEGESE